VHEALPQLQIILILCCVISFLGPGSPSLGLRPFAPNNMDVSIFVSSTTACDPHWSVAHLAAPGSGLLFTQASIWCIVHSDVWRFVCPTN